MDWLCAILIIFACLFGYIKGRLDEASLQRKLRAKLYGLKQK